MKLDRRTLLRGMAASLFAGIDPKTLSAAPIPIDVTVDLTNQVGRREPDWIEIFDVLIEAFKKHFGQSVEPGSPGFQLCTAMADQLYDSMSVMRHIIESFEIKTVPVLELDALAKELRMFPPVTITVKQE